MSEKTKENIVIFENKGEQGLISVIEKAISSPDLNVDKMGKMLDLQERVYDKHAEKMFNSSMSSCQAEMPTVVRDKTNSQTNSSYARFETVQQKVQPTYTKHGFALTFGTGKSEISGHIRITCRVLHKEGHSADYHVDLPPDDRGIKGSVNKTGMHAVGSTHSYGKRYLLTMIFNIAIADHDDDGVKAGAVTIESVLEHQAWVRENFDSVAELKRAINSGDSDLAYGIWQDLDEEDKRSIWLAPTKGGILTTAEREFFKSNDYCKARARAFGGEK